MNDNFLDRLRAETDEKSRELLALEFILDTLDADLRPAVQVAAIPHWFDEEFAAALLQISIGEAQRIVDALKAFSFVEPFPGRGYNVHERTRALLLERLWSHDRQTYREFSQRAERYADARSKLAPDANARGAATPVWTIEAIYHCFMVDQRQALDRMNDAAWDWIRADRYDRLEAMARVIAEHSTAGRLGDEARSWLIFWQAKVDQAYARLNSAREKYSALKIDANALPELAARCMLGFGDVLLMLSEYEEAKQKFDKATELCLAADELSGQAHAFVQLGQIAYLEDRAAEGHGYYSRASAIYKSLDYPEGEAECLSGIADILRIQGDLAGALERLLEAREIFLKVESKQRCATTTRRLADVYNSLDKYHDAMKFYDEALAVFEETGDRIGQAGSLYGLGIVRLQRDEYALAQELLESALGTYRDVGSPLGEGNSIRALADMHRLRGEAETAKEAYNRAADVYRKIADRLSEFQSLIGLAHAERDLGHYSVARSHYQSALPVIRSSSDKLSEADSLSGLAELERLEEQTEPARRLFDAALAIFQAAQSRRGEADCRRGLADVHALLGQYDEALREYTEALRIAREIECQSCAADSLYGIGQLNQAQNKFDAARRHYENAQQIYQTIGARRGEDRCKTALDALRRTLT